MKKSRDYKPFEFVLKGEVYSMRMHERVKMEGRGKLRNLKGLERKELWRRAKNRYIRDVVYC
jgi:hypothetical protein